MCTAANLTAIDLAYFKKQLYTAKDKVAQDAILLSHMDIMPVKRRREVDEGTRQRQRDVTIKYFVLKEDKTHTQIPHILTTHPILFSTLYHLLGKHKVCRCEENKPIGVV